MPPAAEEGDNGKSNSAPVADAGPDQNLATGATVTLDGSGSWDADGNTLTYSWSFANVPGGSSIADAALSNAAVADPTFPTDLSGPYVVQLVVNDGTADSAADTVTHNCITPQLCARCRRRARQERDDGSASNP